MKRKFPVRNFRKFRCTWRDCPLFRKFWKILHWKFPKCKVTGIFGRTDSALNVHTYLIHTVTLGMSLCGTTHCVSTVSSQPCRPCIQTHESHPVCPSCGCRCFVCIIHFHVRGNHPILQSCSVFNLHPWRILH